MINFSAQSEVLLGMPRAMPDELEPFQRLGMLPAGDPEQRFVEHVGALRTRLFSGRQDVGMVVADVHTFEIDALEKTMTGQAAPDLTNDGRARLRRTPLFLVDRGLRSEMSEGARRNRIEKKMNPMLGSWLTLAYFDANGRLQTQDAREQWDLQKGPELIDFRTPDTMTWLAEALYKVRKSQAA